MTMQGQGMEWIQFGALGLLGVILIWGGRWAAGLVSRVVDRLIAAFDAINGTLQKLLEEMQRSTVTLSEKIDRTAQETREEIRELECHHDRINGSGASER